MSSTSKGHLLFPVHILHAFNALQHLRVMLIIGDTTNDEIFSTAEDIAREIGAPLDSIWRSLTMLARANIVQATKFKGYSILPNTLEEVRVKDVLHALGKELPDNGHKRASDRLLNAVADCLDITLEEFFK